MYTANHLHVKAIVASPRGVRRRCGCPGPLGHSIYAFTRHEARVRVTLYRGVYSCRLRRHGQGRGVLLLDIRLLLDLETGGEGDSVILTKGELSGVSAGRNSMQICA